MGLKVVTVNRYLGNFISNRKVETEWLVEKVSGWNISMEIMDGMAHRHPQIAYTGL